MRLLTRALGAMARWIGYTLTAIFGSATGPAGITCADFYRNTDNDEENR